MMGRPAGIYLLGREVVDRAGLDSALHIMTTSIQSSATQTRK